ncbi:MAG: hypothetical protein EPO13_08440 [Actinomycetota bacterium]|nr:MAG: hypothetical protein EPO13_08440 [Actinomycetota bacterium]
MSGQGLFTESRLEEFLQGKLALAEQTVATWQLPELDSDLARLAAETRVATIVLHRESPEWTTTDHDDGSVSITAAVPFDGSPTLLGYAAPEDRDADPVDAVVDGHQVLLQTEVPASTAELDRALVARHEVESRLDVIEARLARLNAACARFNDGVTTRLQQAADARRLELLPQVALDDELSGPV